MKTIITSMVCAVCFFLQPNRTYAQWVNCPNTFSLSGYTMAVNGSTIWAGTQGGVYVSTNNGASFNRSNSGISNSLMIHDIFVSGTTLFALVQNAALPLYRSTDNGASWQLKNTGLSWSTPAPFYINDIAQLGSTLFVATSGGVYRSLDQGDNWSLAGLAGQLTRVVKSNGNKLYAATSSGLFISSDNGVNWAASGLISTDISDLGFKGNLVFACFSQGNGLAKSIDEGQTFNSIPNTTVSTNLLRKMAIANNKILLVGENVFIVFDIDSNTYSLQNTGLTTNNVYSLVVAGEQVYCGTINHGFFKRPLAELGVTSTVSVASMELPNFTIYPNPAREVVNILLGEAYENVSVIIYDFSGRAVYSENILTQQTQIDISFLPKGLYLTTLIAKQGIVVKKMFKY